jgi:hypothetical protein
MLTGYEGMMAVSLDFLAKPFKDQGMLDAVAQPLARDRVNRSARLAKLHAIPWSALNLNTAEKCFYVDIAAQRLKDDPGFDKDHWPSMADEAWGTSTRSYYNRQPYWQATRDVVESELSVSAS